MGYALPTYNTLKENADSLWYHYSDYKPPSYKELISKIATLKKAYEEEVKKKTQDEENPPKNPEKSDKKSGYWFFSSLPIPKSMPNLATTTPTPERYNQIDVIVQLEKHLAQQIKAKQIGTNQAHIILLGALFHRLYRIKAEYDKSSSFVKWTASKGSALYRVIKRVLNVAKERELNDQYISICCGELYKYLEKNKGVYRYIKDEHIKNLGEIVDAANTALRNNSTGISLDYCIFIQSVANGLYQAYEEVSHAVSLLSERDEKEIYFTQSELDRLFKRQKITESAHQFIKDIMPSDKVKAIDIKKYAMGSIQYALLGAYLIVLSKSKDKKLNNLLNRSIGVNPLQLEPVDDKTQELALTAFENFLSLPGRKDIICKPFKSLTEDIRLQIDQLTTSKYCTP